MLNLTQIKREGNFHPLLTDISDYFGTELYLADDVADYELSRDALRPPWFKHHPFTTGAYYARILIYNVGIDALELDGKLVTDAVEVHDGSASILAHWIDEPSLYPAYENYCELLESSVLKEQDWVYRLVMRHSYDGTLAFISRITKDKFTRKKNVDDSLPDRIHALLPEIEPLPQPSF